MSATNETLARRWLASRHWGGWRAGMQSQLGWLCIDEGIEPDHQVDQPWPMPNLSHPGTRAFLLEDVRRAWGPWSYVDTFALYGGAFCIGVLSPNMQAFRTADHDSEAEALIAALEAAP